MEETAEQKVSEHHMLILTQRKRVAEILMNEERSSQNTKAMQARRVRCESSAYQIQARDEFNEHFNNQSTSLRQQAPTELQTQHHQNAQQTLQFQENIDDS